MTLDLSKPMDFAKATGSAFAQLLSIFGRPPENWQIKECAFNWVPMHIIYERRGLTAGLSSIKDSGGRRLAQFQYPYMDGQTTDDLGRAPEKFDVDTVFYGDAYREMMDDIFTELQQPQAGWLMHPVRGMVKCKMQSYTMTHEHQSRKAALINITFVEHNFDVATYGEQRKLKSFSAQLAALLSAVAVLQNLINSIQGTVNMLNSIKDWITQIIDAFDALLADTTVDLNMAFNGNGAKAWPSILPVTQGGVATFTKLSQSKKRVESSGVVTYTQSRLFSAAAEDPFSKIPLQRYNALLLEAQSAFATSGSQSMNSANSGALGSGDSVFATGSNQTSGVTTYGLNSAQLSQLANSVGAAVLQNKVNACRDVANDLIANLSAVKFGAPSLEPLGTDSDGALAFEAQILDIKRIAILLQEAYDIGSAQAKLGIKTYTTPKLMSLREVAFVNNLDVEDVGMLDLLNAELDSVNYIPSGTEVIVLL